MNSVMIPLSALDPAVAAEQYFNERFPDNYSTMNANPNFEKSGCGIAVTADSAKKTLTVPNPADTSKALCTVEYSKDSLKFVYPKAKMVGNVIDVGVGSTDKINCLTDTYDKMRLNVVIEYGGAYSGKISDNIGTVWGICYGNDKFVAVGDNSYFAYSTDGITWTEGILSNTSKSWGCICYGNDKYITVAYDSNIFVYSTDGIHWTESTISDTNRKWNRVCYGNGIFVMLDESYSGIFAYSTDGIHWTEGRVSDANRSWHSICYGNGKFMIATTSPIFAYSTDGIHWTEITNNYDAYWWAIGYGNDKFVAVDYSSSIFSYSTDGINWTKGIVSSTNRNMRSICYGNGKYIITFGTSSEKDNYFAYSTDGINWYESMLDDKYCLVSTCYSPNLDRFVTVGTNGAFVVISLPGNYSEGIRSIFRVNYTWSAPSDVTCALPTSGSYAKDSTFAVDTTYTDKSAFVVSDGYYQFSGWNKSDFNVTEDTTISGSWSKITYTWNPIKLTDKTQNSDNYSFHSIMYGNGIYVLIVGGWNVSMFTYFTSTDGINWTEREFSKPMLPLKFIFFNNKFILTSMYTSSHPALYSTDGINWNTLSANFDTIMGHLIYNNTLYLAGDDYLWTTTDGINYTSSAFPSHCFHDCILHNGNKFIVTTRNSNKYWYSTNGVNWTENTISETSQFWCYGLIDNNNNFILVSSENDAIIAKSSDGINWEIISLNIDNPASDYRIFGIQYYDGTYIMISRHNDVYYSLDLINWRKKKISNNIETDDMWLHSLYILNNRLWCNGHEKYVFYLDKIKSNDLIIVN